LHNLLKLVHNPDSSLNEFYKIRPTYLESPTKSIHD